MLIPSQVERQVDVIASRLQQPLETFQAIHAKSLELLLWINNEPGSIFAITSATPIFGIELSQTERDKWANGSRQRWRSSAEQKEQSELREVHERRNQSCAQVDHAAPPYPRFRGADRMSPVKRLRLLLKNLAAFISIISVPVSATAQKASVPCTFAGIGLSAHEKQEIGEQVQDSAFDQAADWASELRVRLSTSTAAPGW